MDKALTDSVANLPGVGPATSERMESIGLRTVNDLIYHFPARYDNIQARDISTILDNEKVTLKGRVVTEPVVSYFGPKKSRLVFRLAVTDTDIIQVVFFNQPYLKNNIQLGQTYAVYGTWQEARQSLNGRRVLQSQEDGAEFSPIYSTTQGLSQSQIIKAIRAAFDMYGDLIEEIIPDYLNDKYQMLPLNQALYQMHFPDDKESHFQAERKIIFQEFYLYQWRLQVARLKQKEVPGIIVNYEVDELRKVIQALPFELTGAQKRVVNEICYDLLAPYPMKRMLQGDVGSGKTMVAFLAMIASLLGGYQSALLVPTEILAKQHQQSFNKTFEKIGLKAELLVGKMKTQDKKEVIDGLETGRIRLVIGTHALIQDGVNFKQLGLVVIDEQHRFGVGQRQALLDKGQSTRQTNLLQMTATPIPRTLALSMFGEFSVSTIDELPKGRQEISTYLAKPSQMEGVYQSIREELDQGRQVYYVIPIIESSEHTGDLENVYEAFERLNQQFPDYTIQVIHGQMPKEEQEIVMENFQANRCQLLVATTVIEVGVDVPNATLMVIQSAERFGLAQLHQLRGRVGRGQHKSSCILIGEPTTDQGKERMEIMLGSQDGFKISEADMKLRGIGDVLGREQSGVPDFNYANLYEDRRVHEVARQEVIAGLNSQTLLNQEDLDRLEAWSSQVIIEI